MQQLDDNMDELFRRAAENFPLQEAKDWESVQSRLLVENKTVAPLKPGSLKRIKLSAIFLLLLIFISTGIIYNYLDFKQVKEGNSSHTTSPLKKSSTAISDKKIAGNMPYETESIKQEVYQDGKKSKERNNGTYLKKNDTVLEEKIGTHILNYPNEILNPKFTSSISTQILSVKEKVTAFSELKLKPNEEIKNKLKSSRTFYIGLSAGLGYSWVGTMPLSFTNGEGGIVAGYSFGNKFSLETGFLISKKYYKSSGTSFKMDKMKSAMPSGMEIERLEGQSKLVEIPVKALYNLYNRKQNKIFISAGASAFFLKKEFNHYHVILNGQEGIMAGYYNTKDFIFPATVNLSAGWQHSVSRSLDIRLEPYLQLPLKGIGVGKLPIKSAGIHIGVLRRF
ncbi:MAG: hypothetical protein ABI784_07560 [Ginsengibacter sp.]